VLVHFRLTVPDDLSEPVRQLLLDSECVTNVTVHEGVCLAPEGDLIEADVAREKAGVILHHLNELDLDERGGILIDSPTGTPFREAERLEAAAPGHPDDAVIWEQVLGEAEDGAQPTVSYVVFLVLAVILAAIAVVTDSAVLVVGAMVVGPEFSAIAAASIGLVFWRWSLVWRSVRLLVLSFVFAIAVVAVLAFLASLTGAVDASMITKARPNTGFIWKPDMWSFVVALVAGAAGVLALAIEKTQTMVGVFISVTTVPAAGNLALGLALWQTSEIVGSLEQLGANIAGMVLAGVLVIAFMRGCWDWVTQRSESLFGRRPRRQGLQPKKVRSAA
jgi:uncharacterized hydrophobic protein (TIGR00271 family)